MKLRVLTGMIALLMMTASLWAADTPAADATAAFAQLKSLAGEWESKAPDRSKSRARYEVVSGGSAVVEHFESDALGAANAMVTVYYLEGDRLSQCFRQALERPCSQPERRFLRRKLAEVS